MGSCIAKVWSILDSLFTLLESREYQLWLPIVIIRNGFSSYWTSPRMKLRGPQKCTKREVISLHKADVESSLHYMHYKCQFNMICLDIWKYSLSISRKCRSYFRHFIINLVVTALVYEVSTIILVISILLIRYLYLFLSFGALVGVGDTSHQMHCTRSPSKEVWKTLTLPLTSWPGFLYFH